MAEKTAILVAMIITIVPLFLCIFAGLHYLIGMAANAVGIALLLAIKKA